jgi:tetratricopeptide (TPR) repeat protein
MMSFQLFRACYLYLPFLLILCCRDTCSNRVVAHPIKISGEVLGKITKLNDFGKHCLVKKQYHNAQWYFTAILSLTDGLKGQKGSNIRRKCGLSLAECELKTGRYQRAIARCTDVIVEASNDVEESFLQSNLSKIPAAKKSLLRSLALAHFKRAVALKYLEKPQLSMIDLKEALDYQPDDSNILEEIVETHFQNGTFDGPLEPLKDELLDFSEQCQINYPKMILTDAKISGLCNHDLSSSPPPSTFQNAQLNPFSMFSQLSGQNNGLATLLNFIPGLQPDTIKTLLEIASAATKVYRKVHRMYTFVGKHKMKIILSSSLLWILFISISDYFPHFYSFHPFQI